MTYKEALNFAIEKLKDTVQPSETARYFLRHATGKDLASILAYPETPLSAEEEKVFKAWIEDRESNMPVGYVRGEEIFWGMPFKVDGRVLIPRPETEILIERVIKEAGKVNGPLLLADIGTGSGAIGIALAKSLHKAKVYLVDLSAEALAVAKENAKINGAANVEFFRGNLLDPLPEAVDFLVANLPYIPSGDIGNLDFDVHHFEPRLALEGGPDGLDLYREFFKQAPAKIKEDGKIFLEIGEDQGPKMVEIAKEVFPEAKVYFEKDWADLDRFVFVEL